MGLVRSVCLVSIRQLCPQRTVNLITQAKFPPRTVLPCVSWLGAAQVATRSPLSTGRARLRKIHRLEREPDHC